MNRANAAVIFAVLIILALPAYGGQLFGGAPMTGEGDGGRLPSSPDSPQCNRCELDPVELHGNPPRAEPAPPEKTEPTEKPEPPEKTEPAEKPAPPEKEPDTEPKGSGGSGMNNIQ
ncbi:hypothetical protein [Iodidimonas sp. SYSU 1G8]|uniref:hypothetical protein n=1 Tax=Iodidimonas sp. SYSU 1G8 TaxID=3133967 RepID=UPI0031FE66F8